MIKNKYAYFFIMFFVILGAILIIGRDEILYSLDSLYNKNFDTSSMTAYEYNSESKDFVPYDSTATVVLEGFKENANVIILSFESGLKENTTFYLYNASIGENQYLMSRQTVRKGYKKVVFEFTETEIDKINVIAKAYDESHLTNIPNGYFQICKKSVNIVSNKSKAFVILLVSTIISCIISFILTMLKYRGNAIIDRKERDSNLELLRVLCMICLIAHHLIVHGGALLSTHSLPKYVGILFIPVGKICFICFLAISMYFLTDGEFKAERYYRCWLEVVFYSVTLTCLTWILGGVVRVRDFISSFFVMTSNSHGFAASYLLFLLIYPFILKATKNCSKKQARYLLVVLIIIQIVPQIMKSWTDYTQPVYSELTLFVLCYVLSLNLKRYPFKMLESKWFSFFMLAIIYCYFLVLYILYYKGYMAGEIGKFILGISADESSMFYIAGGYSLFYLFKDLHIKKSAFINNLAAGAFGVLLIHDHNFLRGIFWNKIVKTSLMFSSRKFVLEFLLAIISIFFVCSVIDYIRRMMIETAVMKTRTAKNIVNKTGKLFMREDDSII